MDINNGQDNTTEGNTMAGQHSSKQYDQDLEWIRSKVLLMGGLVEDQFRDAMISLENSDDVLADKVIKGDEKVNRQEVELDHSLTELIVRRQPAANDLRNVTATGKVITDLERIGDEATKIARSAKSIRSRELLLPNHYQTVAAMSQTASRMLREALDAYARMDRDQAIRLMALDSVIDHEFHDMMKDLIKYMSDEPGTVAAGLDILWAAKAIERIGDHATNIGEYVIYVVDGEDIRHTDYRLQFHGTII